jgi:hypothetical protein
VWLRIHDLGIVAAGTLLSVPEGVVVERASGRPFLIEDPQVALANRGGEELVVVRWLLGGQAVESRFRPDDREEALAWAS